MSPEPSKGFSPNVIVSRIRGCKLIMVKSGEGISDSTRWTNIDGAAMPRGQVIQIETYHYSTWRCESTSRAAGHLYCIRSMHFAPSTCLGPCNSLLSIRRLSPSVVHALSLTPTVPPLFSFGRRSDLTPGPSSFSPTGIGGPEVRSDSSGSLGVRWREGCAFATCGTVHAPEYVPRPPWGYADSP